jgi:hypothetical protein
VGLLALGAVVGGAVVAVGGVIAVVVAVDGLTGVVFGWPGARQAGGLDELHGRAVVAVGGGGVIGCGYVTAAVLYLVEMIVRQVVIFAAVAAAPLLATDLRGWCRSPRRMTAVRWALTVIVIKPALTLALIVGIEVAPAGGLLAVVSVAAVLVLLISAPVTLFQLLAFLDPGTPSEARAAGRRPTRSGRGGSTTRTALPTQRVCRAMRRPEPADRLAGARRLERGGSRRPCAPPCTRSGAPPRQAQHPHAGRWVLAGRWSARSASPTTRALPKALPPKALPPKDDPTGPTGSTGVIR